MGDSKPRFLLVSTSDRYDQDWEQATIAGIDDLELSLRQGNPGSEDELIELARDADALLISSRDAVSSRVISSLERCRVISRYAVGLDHIDLDAAAERGIVVTHFPDYCTNEVADHTLAMMLALNRRILQFDRDLRAGAWNEHAHHMDRLRRGPIPALRESTLGIVGLGRIGSAVAARAHAFGLTVIASDPYAGQNQFTAAGVESVGLDALLDRSDIVTLHCPLTRETAGLIDARALTLVKPTAFLVNTARGPIVDLPAAIDALSTGRLAGAAFDVVYPEPLPQDSPLYQLPNVILTPHAAYYSERSVETVRSQTLLAAIDVLRGHRPRVIANPAVLDRVQLTPA